MQIVIELSDESYDKVINPDNWYDPSSAIKDIVTAIKEGTPLPKGHGRLIDVDKLKECEQRWSCDYEPDGYSHVVEIQDIDDTPTIIEADRSVEE